MRGVGNECEIGIIGWETPTKASVMQNGNLKENESLLLEAVQWKEVASVCS